MNPIKQLMRLLFVLAVITFIASGDTLEFLPKPMREASTTTREFLASLWPEWLKPQDRDAGREKELEQLGQ
ncbi:MAG: hypothetical protein WBA77_19240 [Microcoleaceae cyanobacterium]